MVEKMEVGKKYGGYSNVTPPRECLYVLPDGSALLSARDEIYSEPILVKRYDIPYWKEVVEPKKSEVRYIGVYKNLVDKEDIRLGFNAYIDRIGIVGNYSFNNKIYHLFDTMEIQYVEAK